MLVLMEQYSLGVWSSWVHCTHSVQYRWMVASYCSRQQDLQTFGGGVRAYKLMMRVQHLSTKNHWCHVIPT